MNIENLSTLKIHRLTQAQYDRELEAGRIDENALYLTPNEASIVEETDPTVPAWAKESTKPIYTADEVGADVAGTANNAIREHNNSASSHSDMRSSISGLTNQVNGFINSFSTMSGQIEQLNKEKVNKSGLTLGIHADGLVYLFIDGVPYGNGLDIKADVVNGDVFGYVDENNVIILNGTLTDGTYTIKYEMEDGSTIDIGNLELDSNVYYSVTNNLTNCVTSNSATQVAKGGSYSATITANDGYTIDAIVVNMEGGGYYNVIGNTIDIPNVTGNIVVIAVAEDTVSTIVNLAIPDASATGEAVWNAGGWCNGSYIAGTSYAYRGSTDMTRVTTNTFAVEFGDTIYVKGIKCTDGTDALIALLNANGDRVYNSNVAITSNNSYISDFTAHNGTDYWSFRNITKTNLDNNARIIRLAGYLSGGVNDVVITRNQPIE